MTYPTRKITTYYTAADGTEPNVTLDVTQTSVFDVEVSDELYDLPDSEQAGVMERVTEQFWAAERSKFLLEEAAGERHSSRDEQILDERSDEDVYEGCE